MYHLGITVYSFLFRLVALFHPKADKMVKGHKQTWKQLSDGIDPRKKWIWFHAASLGEFEQGRPVMEKLRADHSEYALLLTFYSPSGYEVRRNYDGADLVCYLPFDKKKNVTRFIRIVRPQMAFFIKYEFWPNYLQELNKKKIPTYLISGIFRKEQAFFKPYLNSYRKLLSYFTHFFVQNEESASLLASIGYTDNVTISGDTRFDRVLEIASADKQLDTAVNFREAANPGIILVAGSTWPQDESMLIPYFNTHPELKLIIAPHEINDSHLDQIESMLLRPYARYSTITPDQTSKVDCLIIDGFGLLSSMYRYGDLAYVGGGFGTGIHNTLEAAVYSIPVLFGPKCDKFMEAKELIACEGGLCIESETAFNERVDLLLNDPADRCERGKKAGEMVKKGSGGSRIILDHLFNTHR
jgi:3-deoxy-D-manno-octulosonic-acid transferase